MKGDKFSGFVFNNKKGFVFSKDEVELIKENVKRIISTRKGDRVNEPEFGSRVKEFLFRPQIYIDDVASEIKASVEKFEPRVKVKSCTFVADKSIQEDVVNIKLEMEVKNGQIIKTEVEV